MTKLPALDVPNMINFLVGMLNTPSPTGFTEKAIDYTEEAFSAFPFLELRRTRKGALVATWQGEKSDAPRGVTAHADTLGAMVKEIKPNGRLKLTKIGGFPWNTVEGEGCTVFASNGEPVRGSLLLTAASVHVYGSKLAENKRDDDNMEVRLDARTGSTDETSELGIQVGDFVAVSLPVDYVNFMARPLRIEFDGAYYHVLSRGNKQQAIFLSDQDRNIFLKTIGRMSERFEVDIIAFVLMDNHYHLLIQTNRPNLSKSMQWLGTTYTTIFNLRHSQKGHLFQGRFKSILVENESYLMNLSYYIHRNPVRGGLVRRLIDYPWSSYPTYAYNRRSPAWLKTDIIFSRFGQNTAGRKAYREKVQEYAEEKKSIWEDITHGVIYGSQDFVDRIKKDYLKEDRQSEIPVLKKITGDVEIGEVINTAATILQFDIEKAKASRRVSKKNKVNRDMLVFLLWQSGLFKNSEIGDSVGLTPSAVSRRVGIFRELLDKEKELRDRFDKFKSIIKV